MSSTPLNLSCHCTASNHTFLVPTSSLPLPSYLCSCDISRRISGSLLTSYINITHGSDAQNPNLLTLTPYDSSEVLRRWFCKICGTHMYLEYNADGHFEAATGTLRVDGEGGRVDGVVEFKGLMWIGDTDDGGASRFIWEIGGRKVERWVGEAGKSEKVDLNWTSPSIKLADIVAMKKKERKPIHAHCHCRGVEFWISHPNEVSRETKSPFPDLLIPHHLNKSANPENVNWWLPGDGERYLVGTCACTSCKRASGFDITFWAFIPTANIFLDEGLTRPFSSHTAVRPDSSDTTFNTTAYWGTQSTYTSSPGVTRTFCSICGANVFWNGDNEHFGREGLLDVAVGLLDAKCGARAEELLAWWPGRVSFEEDGMNKALVAALEIGLKKWGEENNGEQWVARFGNGVLEGVRGEDK